MVLHLPDTVDVAWGQHVHLVNVAGGALAQLATPGGRRGGGRFTTEAAAIPFIIVLLLAEIVQTQILKIVQQTAKKNP